MKDDNTIEIDGIDAIIDMVTRDYARGLLTIEEANKRINILHDANALYKHYNRVRDAVEPDPCDHCNRPWCHGCEHCN